MRLNISPAKLLNLPAIRAEKARRSLREFVRQGWDVVEPHIPFVPNWHIDAICDHLQAVSEGRIKKLIINVPPGHMKSLTVCVFWPAWEWATTPHTRWLYASYSSDLSVRDSNRMRLLIKSDWYRDLWGDVYTLTKEQEKRIDNNQTGFRVASSTGGMGTGERVHRAVSDDLLRANDAHSEAMRRQAIGHLQAMSTRGVNPDEFAQVLIMQRLHENDPAGWLLEHGGWDHLCLPAEFVEARRCQTSIGFVDPRTKEGELLWPAQFPQHQIDDIKRALGSYGAAGQLQQLPSPDEGGIIKRQWWKYIRPEALAKMKFRRIIQSWDTAFKDNANSDRSACTTWGETDTDFYLLHCWSGKLEYPDLKRQAISLWREWGAHAVLIEDKASGQSLIQEMKRETRMPVLPIRVDGNKVARAHAVTPLIEAGRVYLKDGEPWLGGFLDECSLFPNGTYLDIVDSMTQAITWMAGRSALDQIGLTIGKL